MKNNYKAKKVVLIILIIIIIGAIVISISHKKESVITENNNSDNIVGQEELANIGNLCYYRSYKTDSGLYDIAWLKMIFSDGGKWAEGEFQNLPAEKDSKIGKFQGVIDILNQSPNKTYSADLWWFSKAEGMENTEELIVNFKKEEATVGFGEMKEINRDSWGLPVYGYKDKANLTYGAQMSQIDCETLDEKLFTEKYIRDNIKTIATNKPVLGGSWYVISVVVNPVAHTGEVTYEDGHIQSTANFIYAYSNNPQSVTVTKWEVIE